MWYECVQTEDTWHCNHIFILEGLVNTTIIAKTCFQCQKDAFDMSSLVICGMYFTTPRAFIRVLIICCRPKQRISRENKTSGRVILLDYVFAGLIFFGKVTPTKNDRNQSQNHFKRRKILTKLTQET